MRQKVVRSWFAASVLCVLGGCAVAPPPPAHLPGAPAAATPAADSSPPRRFWERLQKPQAAPEAVAPPAEAAEPSVDKKYQFTGEEARELERGAASWYGPGFHGRLTANGERYDKYALTAAHKTLPFGTIVRVRSLALGREVDVRINDRGPFAPGRVIDVSQAAAEVLGLTNAGVGEVSLNVAESTLEAVQSLVSVNKRRGNRSSAKARAKTGAKRPSAPARRR